MCLGLTINDEGLTNNEYMPDVADRCKTCPETGLYPYLTYT